VIASEKKDTSTLNALLDLARSLRNTGRYDSALTYTDAAISLCDQLLSQPGNPPELLRKKLAAAFVSKGVIHYYQGQFAEAVNYYNKVIAIARDLDPKLMANAYIGIGSVFYNQGNYTEAVKNYYEVLRIGEQLNDNSIIGKAYSGIGVVLDQQGNYREALAIYTKCLKIKQVSGEKRELADLYNNMGVANHYLDNYPEAWKNHFEAFKLRQEIGDKKGMAASLNNLAYILNHDGNYEEALRKTLESIRIRKEINDAPGLASSYLNLGLTYQHLQNFSESEKWFSESLRISKQTGSKDLVKKSYQGLSEMYSAAGKYRQALEAYKLSIVYFDSLVNESNTRKMVQSQMQYEFAKQQAADSIRNAELLKQESLKHDQEIRQQRLYTFGGIIGFALMLVVAGVSFNAYRQKQKANEIIFHQKQLVEEKQKEILDSIHYAKRIQQALLTAESYIERSLKKWL
jgi:tetratricopeptide (TPR) repeat protein